MTCNFAGLLLLLVLIVAAATPDEWRGKAIYQVLTDRFARTDGSMTSTCNTQDRRHCGGTWQGIISHLDYIQGMGFTAIWISPITLNIPQNTYWGEAYHGYWQQNIDELNPRFGTSDDLKALSNALHGRGMYLMVDVVVNHFGFNGDVSSVDYAQLCRSTALATSTSTVPSHKPTTPAVTRTYKSVSLETRTWRFLM